MGRCWILEVEAEPKGQPRPRAFVRNGRARVYDAGTAEHFKSAVAVSARSAGAAAALSPDPIELSVRCRFRRPKAHFTKRGLRADAPSAHLSKPDADNVVKAIADALSQVGVWRDDCQVAWCLVEKRYVNDGEVPGASITITERPEAGAQRSAAA